MQQTAAAWGPPLVSTRVVGSTGTVWIDGEPGYTQIRLEEAITEGRALPEFERYYTVGMNVGDARCAAPTEVHLRQDR